MSEQLTHPTPEELNAFSLGQLPSEQAEAIEAHITECQPCCETLLNVSDNDTFVELLKEADRTPDEATVDLNINALSGSREAAAEIPSSLLDHARYRVVGLVGRGGMGDVYQAEHRMMERTVALKVINRDLISKPEAVERFHREVCAAARLSHSNIVTAYDAEQAGDVHFLAMEFVDGTELSEIVKQRGPLPVGEAVHYIRQAAAGLQHADEMGMVHRDVKPQNLMLDASGNVKILDFGLANFANESAAEVVGQDASDSGKSAQVLHHLTQLGAMMGTPDYIAPEQARDARSADIRSDIYSLGCTLYYLLAGNVPFPGDSVQDKLQAHATGNSQPIHELRSDLPKGLEDVLKKMMSQEPGERFQTPAEVSAALQPYVVPIESKRPLVKSAGNGNRKHFRWIAAAAAAALLCGVVVVVTDRGRIELLSDVEDVEIVVSQDGRQVRVLDVVSGTSVHWLPSGEYQVAVSGDSTANVTIGPETVTIDRFGKELVRIQPDPAAQDKQQIQGTWIAESGERGGKPLAQNQIGVQRLEIEGNRMRLTMPGGLEEDILFTLDVDKNPHQIHLQIPDKNKEMRGIYKVQGDRLTICVILDPTQPVPTEFTTRTDTQLDLIVLQRGVARPEIHQELMALIEAAGPDLTDEQLKQALTKHAPMLAEFDIDASRALVGLLTGLPNKAPQALLREGYLKWQFKSLDAGRQITIRTFLSHLIAPTEKMGFPTGIVESGIKMMVAEGNVGFAVLNDPDSTTQFVVWYLLAPNSPMPIMFPLVGNIAKMENVITIRSVHDQLFALLDKPYSDLPTVNSPRSESAHGGAS